MFPTIHIFSVRRKKTYFTFRQTVRKVKTEDIPLTRALRHFRSSNYQPAERMTLDHLLKDASRQS